jgi:hypothetical protein
MSLPAAMPASRVQPSTADDSVEALIDLLGLSDAAVSGLYSCFFGVFFAGFPWRVHS